MKPIFVIFVLAVSSALAMRIRPKRQSSQPDDSNDLDDRYGPWQGRPTGNRFPGQGQFQQNRFPGQNQFPGQTQLPGQSQFPGQGQMTNQQPMLPPTTAAPNGRTVQDCMRTCPVTSEYNPVCGTDGATYTNPGRLACAQACGVSVSLMRSTPCPSTTVAPS